MVTIRAGMGAGAGEQGAWKRKKDVAVFMSVGFNRVFGGQIEPTVIFAGTPGAGEQGAWERKKMSQYLC